MANFNTATQHAFAREALTVTSGAVVTLTATVYMNQTGVVGRQMPWGWRKAAGAKIVVRAQSINYTTDGTTPTTLSTGTGATAAALDVITLHSLDAITKFKAIAVGTDSSMEVTYYY